jgi:hypothetical protein
LADERLLGLGTQELALATPFQDCKTLLMQAK